MDKAVTTTSATSPVVSSPLTSCQSLTLTPAMQAQPLNLSQGQVLNLHAAGPHTAVSQTTAVSFPAFQPLGSANIQLGPNPTLLSPTSVQGQATIMSTGHQFVNTPVTFNVNPVQSGATYIGQPIQIISPAGYRQMLTAAPARFMSQAGTNLGNAVLMPIQQNAALIQPQNLQAARILSPTSLAKTFPPRSLAPVLAANTDARSQVAMPINLQMSLANPVSSAASPQVLTVPQYAQRSTPRLTNPVKLQPAVVSPVTMTIPQPLAPSGSTSQLQFHNNNTLSSAALLASGKPPHLAFSLAGQLKTAFTTDHGQLHTQGQMPDSSKPTHINNNIAANIHDEPCDLSKSSNNNPPHCDSQSLESPSCYGTAPGYVENIDSKPPELTKEDLLPFTDKTAELISQEENVVSAIDFKQRKKVRKMLEKLAQNREESDKIDKLTVSGQEGKESKGVPVISEINLPSGDVAVKNTVGEQIPVELEEPEFFWEQYLQETGAQAAPHKVFHHVEASLATGYEKGMMVEFEVLHESEPPTCWLTGIQMVCGELLRLRYEGLGMDRSSDFWCAISSDQLHPVGWAKSSGVPRVPPEGLKASIADIDAFWANRVSGSSPVPEEVLEKKSGLTPVDEIKLGMRVEVQNDERPTHVWVARVMENVGGRLLLRYEGTDRAVHDFWLFYLHWRLHPVGWAKENNLMCIPPKCIFPEQPESVWDKLLANAVKEAEAMPFPANVFQVQEEIPEHDFQIGWKLEAVHPETRTQICPATVIEVIDKYWFTVAIDDMTLEGDMDRVQFCANAASPEIFPQQWCMYKGIKLTPPPGYDKGDFDWPEYLRDTSSAAAPEDSFLPEDIDTDFKRGMKLEAVNYKQPGQICAATITRIVDRLMWIHLDGSPNIMPNHIIFENSHEIFPVGWCESNNYPIKPPRKTVWRRTLGRQTPAAQPERVVTGHMTAEEFRCATYSQIVTAKAGATSAWCPKIYFNHKCFSGPYLSKGRIAELSRSVGPGPIVLVMKEVLTMLINVAYKSSRVLRELQMDKRANPNMYQQQLKAKYKGKSYQAFVEICKTHNHIEAFCRQVCIKLECCPYLFSPNQINDNCPESCSQLTKTKYIQAYVYAKKKKRKPGRPPGSHANHEHGPKKPGKRGRRRKVSLMYRDKMRESEESGNEVKDDMEDDKSSISSGRTEGRRDDDSNDGDYQPVKKKRKYTHHLPPPSMIKTRGAKLPKFTFERRTHKKIPVAPLYKIPEPRPPVTVVKKNPQNISANFRKLDSNPLKWNVPQVMHFLKSTDCAHLAWMFKEQEIDGQALLLLTLPTLQEHLDLKLGPAIKLCHHIETVKIAFFEQFAK